jgi:ribosomal protein S18 acetylase RimI-like enzyme
MNVIQEYNAKNFEDYPFLKYFIQPSLFQHAYLLSRAIAVHTSGNEGGWLAIEGTLTAAEYAHVIHQCITHGCVIPRVSVPRALATQLRVENVSEWVWFLRTQPYPPRALDPRIIKISDNSRDKEISALLKVASPRASAQPGIDPVDFWLLAYCDDILVGSIASTLYKNQHAHLASLAVHPDYRRQGLARELTIRAIQESFALDAFGVSLGVYQDNQNALNLYRALDFDVEIAFTSFDLDSKG